MRRPPFREQLWHEIAETTDPGSRRILKGLLADALRIEAEMEEQRRLGRPWPTLAEVPEGTRQVERGSLGAQIADASECGRQSFEIRRQNRQP